MTAAQGGKFSGDVVIPNRIASPHQISRAKRVNGSFSHFIRFDASFNPMRLWSVAGLIYSPTRYNSSTFIVHPATAGSASAS